MGAGSVGGGAIKTWLLGLQLWHVVLYYPSSGQIYLTSGKDPSHLDDGITQYMWHSLLQSTASSLSSVTVILPSNCFASVQFASIQADYPFTQTTLADFHEDWLSSMVSQPWPDLWHLSMWMKCGEMWWKRETIVILMETRCHLWNIVFKEMIQF